MSEKASAETMLKAMQNYIQLDENQKEFINGYMLGVMQSAQRKSKEGEENRC